MSTVNLRVSLEKYLKENLILNYHSPCVNEFILYYYIPIYSI